MNDDDARQISQRIRDSHMVDGFVTETQFDDSNPSAIKYTRGNGDGALWTGAFLAAEAFRYSVETDTQQKQVALDNVTYAAQGLALMASVMPTKFLARAAVAADSPFLTYIEQAEHEKGFFAFVHNSRSYYWLGWPTRDQYAGALFGLGVAYDLLGPQVPAIKSVCATTIVSLAQALIDHGWKTRNPKVKKDDRGNTIKARKETFLTYPHHRLAILQLARHVDGSFDAVYKRDRKSWSWLIWAPIAWDIHRLRKQYYLLDLDFLYLYWLIHFETDQPYKKRYEDQFAKIVAATTAHDNAHFLMIERATLGSLDPAKAARVNAALKALLCRGFRQKAVDFRYKYPHKGDESKVPVDVADRPYEDFLWQRPPFNLVSGPDPERESAGVDFILPYWMARHYGVI